MSKLDQYYRKLILSAFFTGAWGSPAGLNKIVTYRRNWVGNRETCNKLVPNDYPVNIDKVN
jgi:hypothetical protein